jgi:hypothetical protein
MGGGPGRGERGIGGKSTGFLEGEPEGESTIEDGEARKWLLLRIAPELLLLLVTNGDDRPYA